MIDLNGAAPLLYFAYGADMDPEQMSARRVRPRFAAVARLPGYTLAFHGHSERWDGAEACLRPAAGCDLYGVVYGLSPSALDRLDAWQGVKLDGTGGYFHWPAEVIGMDGTLYSALLYKKAEWREPAPPSDGYLACILAGARSRGLPEAYLAGLEAISPRRAGYPVPKPEPVSFPMAGGSCAC